MQVGKPGGKKRVSTEGGGMKEGKGIEDENNKNSLYMYMKLSKNK